MLNYELCRTLLMPNFIQPHNLPSYILFFLQQVNSLLALAPQPWTPMLLRLSLGLCFPKFYYDVPNVIFLIFILVGLVGFLPLRSDIFWQFWKILSQWLFKYDYCLLSFSSSSRTPLVLLIGTFYRDPYVSYLLLHIFHHICSLSKPDIFHWPILELMKPISCY